MQSVHEVDRQATLDHREPLVMQVEVVGEGPPLVLIGGGPYSSDSRTGPCRQSTPSERRVRRSHEPSTNSGGRTRSTSSPGPTAAW
jgi:hypothetical protein